MKTTFKISVVCALGALMSLPVDAAPSVRALGGAGTYSGTRNAVTARGATRTGNAAINSVRMNNRGASATRTATTPRLAIGKYLGANSVISGGAISSVKPGQSGSGDNSGLRDKVESLSNDFTDLSGTVSDLTNRITDLADELSELSGETVAVEYVDGVLIITQNGAAESIDLTDLSDADAIAELQAAVTDLGTAIDNLQAGQAADLQNYYTKTSADEKFATKDEIPTDYLTESDVADFVTVSEISDMETKTDAAATYATKDEIPTDFVTEAELDAKLSAPDAAGNWMLVVDENKNAQWVSIQIADNYPVQ